MSNIQIIKRTLYKLDSDEKWAIIIENWTKDSGNAGVLDLEKDGSENLYGIVERERYWES